MKADELIGLVYDAALDDGVWDSVVVKLASILDCGQANFEIHDLDTRVMIGRAPLTAPEFSNSYRQYYGKQFNLIGRTRAFPVGQVFHTDDFLDIERLRRSEYYNEWWRPQGVGGGSLLINLAIAPQATVLVIVCKHFGHEFTPEDERTFAMIGGHMRRAVDIHSRLLLSSALRKNGGSAPEGTLIVDRDCRILTADKNALGLVEGAGLLEMHDRSRIASPRHDIEMLVRGAAGLLNGGPKAGECRYVDKAGQPLDLTVLPVRSDNWLNVGKPAAMVQVTPPGLRRKARIERLMSEHGLTRSEALVALEIARGDGRAAAGARLGIKEATVRAHLSAIFEKLDIHRQAELGRFVSHALQQNHQGLP